MGICLRKEKRCFCCGFRNVYYITVVITMNVIITIVAPYDEMRKQMRSFFGENYIQVYLDCTVEECAKRDVKGYYARADKMKNFNGVNDVFEVPEDSELTINTVEEEVKSSVSKILEYIKGRGYDV